MSDELDPLLLRAFAQSARELPDAVFVARIAALTRPRGALPGVVQALPGVVAGVLRAVAIGVTGPLRLRYAAVVALTAAAVTVGSALLSSL